VFVPCEPFQDDTVFAGKVGACPSETPFRCSNLESAPCLVHKQWKGLPRVITNLMLKFVTYGHKKFYNIGPGGLEKKSVQICERVAQTALKPKNAKMSILNLNLKV
jgi:hypothetical protein